MKKTKVKSALIFSCMHEPFAHKDSIKFFTAVKKKYGPFDETVCLGDETDGQAIKFWETDPDLPSSGEELDLAQKKFKPWYKLFPKLTVLESNHGSLPMRKAKSIGLSVRYLKGMKELLEAPTGWNWAPDITLSFTNGIVLYAAHQIAADSIKACLSHGISTVQGHFHTKFEIRYISTHRGLLFGASVGCMLDKQSQAFAYNKFDTKRPIVGCFVMHKGTPLLVPMFLDDNGRWIGKLI